MNNAKSTTARKSIKVRSNVRAGGISHIWNKSPAYNNG